MIPKYRRQGITVLKTFAEKRFKTSPQILDANLIIMYGYLEDIVDAINGLESAINKLATKKDIQEVKVDLKRMVKEKGAPTKKELQKQKEIEKHAKHVYR